MSDNPNSNFDDAPVSGGGASFLEILEKQLASEKQEQIQAETDLSLPLEQKITNKNWKVRKSALEEIASKLNNLDSFDPIIFKYLSQILTDQHQGNLEEAVNILNSYLEKDFPVPKENQNELNTIIKLLIEKCYSSSKQALKDKSKDMIISFVEYLNNTDTLVENLTTIMKSKNQKMSQGAVSISTTLLSLFGSSVFNYKNLSSSMTSLSDKCSPLIKQNIVEFFVELYKWIKKKIKPLIEKKVKDIIKNDIDKGIEQIDKDLGAAYIPQPTKYLGKKPNNAEGEKVNNAGIEENGDIIMDDNITEEIDIFTKKFGFDDKFVERMLKPECKWKEKKVAFDRLTELTEPKLNRKIKNTNRINFMDMVKRLLQQPNQNVKHSIIKCVSNFSIVFGNNFTNEAKEIFPRLIENFSINKLAIVNDLIITLINLSNIIDDNWVNEAIIKYGSKNNICNIAKTNLCTFIEKLLESKNNNNSSNCYTTTIKEIVIKYMEDHSQEIRNKATKLMAYIKNNKLNIYNNNIIKQALNEQKIKKIEELDKTEKKVNNRNIPNNNPNNNNFNIYNSNNSSENNNKKSGNFTSNNNEGNNSEFSLELGGNKKKSNKGRSRNENISKLSNCISADNLSSTPIEDINLSDKDDVINLVKQYIGENNINLFDSKKWQEKKEGFTNLRNYFMNNENEENLNQNYDFYLKFIIIKSKSFKENNLVIFKESLICLNTLIKKLPSFFSKKYYNYLLKLLIERISDKKVQNELTDIIESLIEKTSPKEVILCLIRQIRNKTVPILNGGAIIINNLINPNNNSINDNKIKDNIHLFPIKDIIEFCCFLENNSKSQCRNSGTNILCSLYAFLGSSIKPLLKDLKESTFKAIEEKFEKITVISSNNNSSNNKINNNILEQVFPRVDISKKITPQIIKELADRKWTIKKEAINKIESILISTNNKIQPKGLNDLFNCIKFNLKDSNKNIVKMTLKLIEELGEALGSSGFRQYQKQILPGIISNFADKNTQVKEEAIKCIEKLISIVGFDSIGCYFTIHLNTDNYETKYEILNMLIKNKNSFSNKKEYLKEFSFPLINNLVDKNGNIRNMAEKIVQEIMKYFGIQVFNDAVKNLKIPTIVNQIKLILNKINKSINGNNENINNINFSNNNKKDQKNINNNNELYDEINDEFENKNDNNLNILNEIRNNNFNFNNNNNINNNNININENPYNYNFNRFNSFNQSNFAFNLNNSIASVGQPFLSSQMNNIFSNNSLNPQNIVNLQNNISPINEISYVLRQIYSTDIKTKYQALINLQLLLQNNQNIIDQKLIEEILKAFNTLLSTITKSIEGKNDEDLEIQNLIENNQDIKVLKYLLDVYYFLTSQYNLMSTLSNEGIAYECYERLFIIITEKSLISYQNGTNLIKTLNSIIMNFFSNCNVTISIISLIKIILNYKSNTDDYAQVCTLAIKGLDKFRNLISKLTNILKLNKIFETFYIFFSEFEKTNENLIPHNINEENALAILNSMICEFIKIYGDKIWDIYQNSLSEENKKMDIHLKRRIQLNLRDINNNNLLMNNNFLMINNSFNDINKNDIITMNINNKYKNINKNLNYNNNINNENGNNISNELGNNIISEKNEQSEIMNLVNKLKEDGRRMSTEEKNKYYKKIVSLVKESNQPIISLSTKLDNEYYEKIYELYHSNNQKKSTSINIIQKNDNKIRITLSKDNKNIPNQSNTNNNNTINNNKSNNIILTEQTKRIQEYKNKYHSLTENNDNNKNNLFPNNNDTKNNFNFKGNLSNVVNDENKQINNNINDDLEKRKCIFEQLSLGNVKSKSIPNSQSDIPLVNQSFITSNNIGNNALKLNIDNSNIFNKTKDERAKNIYKNLDPIRLRLKSND